MPLNKHSLDIYDGERSQYYSSEDVIGDHLAPPETPIWSDDGDEDDETPLLIVDDWDEDDTESEVEEDDETESEVYVSSVDDVSELEDESEDTSNETDSDDEEEEDLSEEEDDHDECQEEFNMEDFVGAYEEVAREAETVQDKYDHEVDRDNVDVNNGAVNRDQERGHDQEGILGRVIEYDDQLVHDPEVEHDDDQDEDQTDLMDRMKPNYDIIEPEHGNMKLDKVYVEADSSSVEPDNAYMAPGHSRVAPDNSLNASDYGVMAPDDTLIESDVCVMEPDDGLPSTSKSKSNASKSKRRWTGNIAQVSDISSSTDSQTVFRNDDIHPKVIVQFINDQYPNTWFSSSNITSSDQRK